MGSVLTFQQNKLYKPRYFSAVPASLDETVKVFPTVYRSYTSAWHPRRIYLLKQIIHAKVNGVRHSWHSVKDFLPLKMEG
jgi:hypothetical protein